MRQFRRERLQNHIWGRASSDMYMRKCENIWSYLRKPLWLCNRSRICYILWKI